MSNLLPQRVRLTLPPVVFGLLLLWGWHNMSRSNPLLFPPVVNVGQSLLKLAGGPLFEALWVTLQTMFIGYFAAAALAIPLGLLWGRSQLVDDIIDPYVTFFYPLPRVALIPLIILWFGLGFTGKTVIVFLSTFFDVLVSVRQGAHYVDETLIQVGRSFNAKPTQLFRRIILPASIPSIFIGLRLGIGKALIGVIIAEMFLIASGLGGMILDTGTRLRIADMIALVVVVAAMGSGFTALLAWCEKLMTPAAPAERRFE